MGWWSWEKFSLYIGPKVLGFIGGDYPTISPRVVIFTTLSTCATKFSFPQKQKSLVLWSMGKSIEDLSFGEFVEMVESVGPTCVLKEKHVNDLPGKQVAVNFHQLYP